MNEKCVEYYFDSNKYTKEEIIQQMKKEQLEFEKKKSEISIKLNKYGIYVVKLRFLNKDLTVVQKHKINIIPVKHKTYKGYNTYNSNNRIYGKYKVTKTYNPI